MTFAKSAGWLLALPALIFLLAAPAHAERPSPPKESIGDPLPWPDAQQEATVRMALSRSRYHAEDGHLDVIVERADAPPGAAYHGTVAVSIKDQNGAELYAAAFPAPSSRFVFYPPIPDEMVGRRGVAEVSWRLGEEVRGRSSAEFRVAPPGGAAQAGRVRLHIPNPTGAAAQGIPQTVGVPFPRGALHDEANVRLVDAEGREIPLQTKVTGRWSRYGTIRWLLCDFVAEVDGGPVELFLEYGPEVSRRREAGMRVVPARHTPLVPVVETGMLRHSPEGLRWDPKGEGDYRAVVGPEGGADETGRVYRGGLTGAFIVREDGRRYEVPFDNPLVVEEQGPEKVVLKRSGWYMNVERWGETFCQFKTRYVIHRGSPLIRVFHTWIYTGDSNEDRIRDMGWEFRTPDGFGNMGILTGFGPDGEWADAPYIVQHDYDKADVGRAGGEVAERPLRAPGVMAMEGNGTRLYFGVKDFWQNYPREVGFADGAMVFHEWPRHGRKERRATSDNLMRLWFAHEGESLDFRLPDEWAEPEIHGRLRHERYWPEGQPEAINAQGVAKTTEFWLYLTDDATPPEEAAKVLQGLDEETLRAVVDPEWVAASGAFYEMHHRDVENFPADEAAYELHALAPMVWAERMPIYGKWLWGNMLWTPNLETRTAGIYRGLRKAHQGWPYSWVPFARSGDARFLKFAEAATRTMTDVNYTHFVDERTDNRRGESMRSALPWTRTGWLRDYSEQCDYQFHAYHLTGYRRARDVVEDWAGLIKRAFGGDPMYNERFAGLVALAGPRAPRRTTNLLKTYVEMYQETFDPWFIMAAHVLAQPKAPWTERRLHFWQAGNREYHRFTGCEETARFYVEDFAPRWTDPVAATSSWAAITPQIRQSAYAWRLTGEDIHLQRLAGWLDWTRAATYDGEPWYRKGWTLIGVGNTALNYTGYYLDQFPFALAALYEAGRRPSPLPGAFFQAPAEVPRTEGGDFHWRMPTVAIRKEAGQAVPLRLQVHVGRRPPEDQLYQYTVTGPDGQTVLEGSWDITEEETAALPAEAPAGTYRVQVEGEDPYRPYGYRAQWWLRAFRSLRLPLTPPGVPEVVEFDPEAGLGTAFFQAMYWTRVPEDCEEFEVEFKVQTEDNMPSVLMPLNRVAVWNPDDEAVWKEQHLVADYEGPETLTARVAVPPEHRGKMWMLSAPGWSRGVKPGPGLPRFVALSPDRWFEP